MDIIDVILATKLSSRGQIETYAQKAEQAVTNATSALNSANEAVDQIQSITEQTNTNNENAEAALQMVEDALEQVEGAIQQVSSAIEGEISNNLILDTEITPSEDETAYITKTSLLYNNEPISSTQVVKNYNDFGENTDGSMTQQALTQAYADLDNFYISKFDRDPNFNDRLIKETRDGGIIPTDITEEELFSLLLKDDSFDKVIGIEIDYENKTVTRTNGAKNLSAGEDFDQFEMYQRERCNVDEQGNIVAYYGDENYKEDGSNGQVMVRQPLFYYCRIIEKSEKTEYGEVIKKEKLLLSDVEYPGFKRHPAFNKDGAWYSFILLPAYEGSIYNKTTGTYLTSMTGNESTDNFVLSSVANAKPAYLFLENAFEAMARNAGGSITTLEMESLNQMLFTVEYASLNGQSALSLGICNIPDNTPGACCASLTGSTAALGNESGVATSTINEINGRIVEYTEEGKVAFSYRGMENIWGNIWHYASNASGKNNYYIITGDGTKRGGVLSTQSQNPASLSYSLPNVSSWISGFGYDETFDWLFLPIESGANANSALPVGDNVWITANLNTNGLVSAKSIGFGGNWYTGLNNGLFYYACEVDKTKGSRNYGANLAMYNEDAIFEREEE